MVYKVCSPVAMSGHRCEPKWAMKHVQCERGAHFIGILESNWDKAYAYWIPRGFKLVAAHI